VAVGYAVRRETSAHLPPDVAFLRGAIPLESLEWAAAEARLLNACAHDILLADGLIDALSYYQALAATLGARFAPMVQLRFPADPFGGHDPLVSARLGMLIVAGGEGTEIAVAPRGRQVLSLLETAGNRPEVGRRMVVTTPQALTDALIACGRDHFLTLSRSGAGHLPDAASARSLFHRPQIAALCAGLLCTVAALAAFPATGLLALTGLFGLYFAAVIGLRLYAAVYDMAYGAVGGDSPEREGDALPPGDGDLPVYTVLVPLYREASLLDGLIAALCALDYPACKLDIKIIVESDDADTLAAVRRRLLPPQFEVVTVPDALPKTKPKALNFGLALARGQLVTIFDAEDLPEPGQLRRAAERFAAEPDEVACLQARLAWYNWPESWFTRQLALEYAALFDVFLPALDRLGLPFPLGGTSNHFRGIR